MYDGSISINNYDEWVKLEMARGIQVTVVADKSKSAMVIIIPACMGACCCRMTGARETGADAECLKMLKDAMFAMDMIKGGDYTANRNDTAGRINVDLNLT